MANYITANEYAAAHGLSINTVRTWIMNGKLPVIRLGNSVMVERDAPIPQKLKKRSNKEIAQARFEGSMLHIEIVRAYHVAVIDGTGKEVVSDFTFGTKQEAEKLGEKLKREVEGRG